MKAPIINKSILAFVHTEKTAGTTLIHILRHNFFMRYCDVRPLSNKSEGIFQVEDLKKTLRINPFLACIGGHSIMPFNGLHDHCPHLKYITLLRAPVQRYLSQYQYWCSDLGRKMSFDRFLALKSEYNMQTRRIAGNDKVSDAREILSSECFLLTGILEEFDEFLLLLKKKMNDVNFDLLYERQKVGKTEEKELRQKLIEKYGDYILENNRSDLELYDFVKNSLFPSFKEWYGKNFSSDLVVFKRFKKIHKPKMGKRYVNYVCRKLYYEPLSGFIRHRNGLPAFGAY